MKVKEVMTKGVITVLEDDDIIEIAKIMERHDISGVAVQDMEGNFGGVLTEADIIAQFAGKDEATLSQLKAADIMTPCMLTADPEMELAEVCELMGNERIHRLVVAIEEEIEPMKIGPKYRYKPVGIISTKDIVRVISKG
jgi:CBS domain-containing protein